jgi:hypothetical protein
MLKHAYELGTLLALQEEGLLKTSAPTALEGAKIVGQSALGKLKDFLTAKRVREALKGVSAAKGQPGPVWDPKLVQRARTMAAEEVGLGSSQRDLVNAVTEIRKTLDRATQASPEALAKRELLKSLAPYAATAGGAGLIGAGALTAPKIFPKLGD